MAYKCNIHDNKCFCDIRNSGTRIKSRVQPFKKSNSFVMNPIRRFISAEIEITRLDPNKSILVDRAANNLNLTVKEDGSLPITGFEINSAPSSGDEFYKQINGICNSLRLANAEVDGSCGLHIHVDARDLNILHLSNVAYIARNMQDPLWDVVAGSRKHSGYCLDIKKHYTILSANKCLSDEQLQKQFIDKKNYYFSSMRRNLYHTNDHYKAINIYDAYSRHRTIEFRMHQGSINCDKIFNWGLLCASIIDISKTKSREDIVLFFKQNRNHLNRIKGFCPTDSCAAFFEKRYAFFMDKRKNAKEKQKTA